MIKKLLDCKTYVLIIGVLLAPSANATVDYPGLAVEQRRNQLEVKKMIAQQDDAPKATGGNFEEEKKLITRQLDIIIGDEDIKDTIVPGDTLQVVYTDQGKPTTGIYQVNAEGQIAMPLVGNVKVSGMNRGQARAHLNALLSEYIRNPQLTVAVNAAGKYTVLGAAGAGVYELQPDLKLMEALLRAGIDDKRANLSSVMVMRQGKDKPEILRMNVKKMRKGDRSDDITLKPNDLIYVPNTLFYDVDTFKDKVFEYIADYYTLGGATILKPTEQHSPRDTTE